MNANMAARAAARVVVAKQLARRATVAGARQAGVVRGGGGGGAPLPPMMPRVVPNEPLHEQADLLWDDGVAPEVTIDFDAPNFSRALGVAMWFGGLSFFAVMYNLIKFGTDPPSKVTSAPREFDAETLSTGMGGHSYMTRRGMVSGSE